MTAPKTEIERYFYRFEIGRCTDAVMDEWATDMRLEGELDPPPPTDQAAVERILRAFAPELAAVILNPENVLFSFDLYHRSRPWEQPDAKEPLRDMQPEDRQEPLSDRALPVLRADRAGPASDGDDGHDHPPGDRPGDHQADRAAAGGDAPGDPDGDRLTDEQRARLRKRLTAAVQLAKRAGTDGEREAAMAACLRIAGRLGEELAPYLEDNPDDREPIFDFAAYQRRAKAYRRASETTFDAWVRIVETDEVFVDIYTGWASRARARGWHESAVRAAQDYAAEYGVSPDEVDLGM